MAATIPAAIDSIARVVQMVDPSTTASSRASDRHTGARWRISTMFKPNEDSTWTMAITAITAA